jgi:hypothetical protein
MPFLAKSLNIISRSQDADPDDFMLQVHCELESDATPGGEAMIALVASKQRVDKMMKVSEGALWVGNLIIVHAFDEAEVLQRIQAIVDATRAQDWKQLEERTSWLFEWV